MRRLAFGVAGALFASILSAAQGTVPLPRAAAYRDSAEVAGIGVGATLLREGEVKQRFVTDLGQDFIVVEVALFPESGADLEVLPEKFGLRIGDESTARPENPKVIAAYIQKNETSKRNIVIVPHVGVGYESRRVGYDPTTGTYRRQGGIYTSAGVLVGVEPSSDTNPKNEETMALELTEKGLPGGSFGQPVAGHLYFRVDSKVAKDSKIRFALVGELKGEEVILELKR